MAECDEKNDEKTSKKFGPGSSNPKKSAAKKKKKSFPDLNKDGKVTFADVLKAKKGAKGEKASDIMAKLCPRGKAAAKRKFKVYPSAYANMYASAVCSGKVTPGGKKKKKAMGGGMIKPMYGKGGGVCIRGMNRQAVGKNS